MPSGGATFRVWAPRASAVYVNGVFQGGAATGERDDFLMAKDSSGYWTGFVANAGDGDLYHFWVVGAASSGYKRDPYAREMALDAPFPTCSCVLRSSTNYPWHDAAFVTPDFSNMIVYQLHIGAYSPSAPGRASTFLDIIGKIEYMMSLGINVLQPLPVDEMETDPSMGYNGVDLFSPDFPYVVTDVNALNGYLEMINELLANKGFGAISLSDISSAPSQMKAMVDLCHLFGIAVVLDVVDNGWRLSKRRPVSLFLRLRANGNNNQSLYFTDQDRGTGGLSFALWNNDVRQFLMNNANYYINEFHVDGFRYDEISALLSMNKDLSLALG